MPRTFHPSMNTIARAGLMSIAPLVTAVAWVAWEVENSSYVTNQGIVIDQPIPFSHQHHVDGLGIDCRYCHTSAATSSFAGVPPTKTCMTCHSQIWTGAPLLEPVRKSWEEARPIQWNRVNNSPGYVYFNHDIHVNKGVGCVTCHGQINDMPLTFAAQTLQMSWCLDCHRHPETQLRPREEVFNMKYDAPADQLKLGRELVERYHVRSAQALTECGTCHR